MDYYSIERSAERIYDPRTRDYFREVISSYINGNYRSAVVMLWSVVVCDLVYKLQRLQELYNDTTAAGILKEIADEQMKNPRSPEWELSLLEMVRDRTELMDLTDYQSLEHIQKQRHLSAHPVLSNADLLFSPNSDTVRALMRNALDYVLLKPPVLSKKITSRLVQDLASIKDSFPPEEKDEALQRYLEARYLRNLNTATENRLFRDLWKFVFRLNDANAATNRTINYRALRLIYERRRTELQNYIATEPDYFSDIGTDDEQLARLVDFLNMHPPVYRELTDAALVHLRNYARKSFANLVGALFMSEDIRTHLDELRARAMTAKALWHFVEEPTYPSADVWRLLTARAHEEGCLELALEIAVMFHSKSGNFDSADYSYLAFIQPYLEQFTLRQLEDLLSGIDKNGETYGRRRAPTHYEELVQRCMVVLGSDFRFENYPNFFKRMSDYIESERHEYPF